MIEIKDQEEAADAVELDGRKNVVRKSAATTPGTLGSIAHYHKKENAVESWEEPCYYVNHRVNDVRGYSINEHRFTAGVHVVPQCTADYLSWQESEHLRYEEGIYRGKQHKPRVVGSF